MIKRHPHTATIRSKQTVYDPEKGRNVPGPSNDPIELDCRIDVVASGYVIGDNGSQIKVGYIIYSDLLDTNIPFGSQIEFNGSTHPILKVYKYQTHLEIWV